MIENVTALGKLHQRKWKQVQDGASSCQRLTDPFQKQKVRRPGENEPDIWIVVHDGLDIGKEVWSVLHLIQNSAAAKIRQETTRI